jgi:hypothetical protein
MRSETDVYARWACGVKREAEQKKSKRAARAPYVVPRSKRVAFVAIAGRLNVTTGAEAKKMEEK